MTIVHIPASQPNNGIMTVQEYLLDPRAPWQVAGIHDGWRPLCIRSLEHSLILVALVNTSAPEEAEVFRLILPGDDLAELEQREGVELAFLGGTFDGRYLFLDVKPETFNTNTGRRLGRLDTEP